MNNWAWESIVHLDVFNDLRCLWKEHPNIHMVKLESTKYTIHDYDW